MSYQPGDEVIDGISNCCGANVLMPDLCSDCGEHCEAIFPCRDCEEELSQKTWSDLDGLCWQCVCALHD